MFNTTKFITCTGAGTGSLITIAVGAIITIKSDDTATRIYLGCLDDYVKVKELPEQILEKISQVELHDQQR